MLVTRVPGRSLYCSRGQSSTSGGHVEEQESHPPSVIVSLQEKAVTESVTLIVDMSKLKFVDEAVRTTGQRQRRHLLAQRPLGTATTTSTKNKWYPDHAVLSGATKDSLKNTPEFKFD